MMFNNLFNDIKTEKEIKASQHLLETNDEEEYDDEYYYENENGE